MRMQGSCSRTPRWCRTPRAPAAYLAGGPELEHHFFVDRAAGFTLVPFNELAQTSMGLDVHHVPHEVLSDDFEIFRFDLTHPPVQSEQRAVARL